MKILYAEFTPGCYERFSETMYGNEYERDHDFAIIRKYSTRQEEIVSV